MRQKDPLEGPKGMIWMKEKEERGVNQEGEGDGREEGTDEALPGLLGGELDQRSSTKEESPDEGSDVIADDQGGWEKEPFVVLFLSSEKKRKEKWREADQMMPLKMLGTWKVEGDMAMRAMLVQMICLNWSL